VLEGSFNCLRALYESCTDSDMVGRVGRFVSGQVGLCRVKSGEVGRKKFLRPFLPLRFCIKFFVSGADSCIDSLTVTLSQTPDSRRSSDGWVAGCRDWPPKVETCRERAGSIPLPGLLHLISRTFPRCLGWVLGSSKSRKRFRLISDSRAHFVSKMLCR